MSRTDVSFVNRSPRSESHSALPLPSTSLRTASPSSAASSPTMASPGAVSRNVPRSVTAYVPVVSATTSSMMSLPTHNAVTGISARISRSTSAAVNSAGLVSHTKRKNGGRCRSAPTRSRRLRSSEVRPKRRDRRPSVPRPPGEGVSMAGSTPTRAPGSPPVRTRGSPQRAGRAASRDRGWRRRPESAQRRLAARTTGRRRGERPCQAAPSPASGLQPPVLRLAATEGLQSLLRTEGVGRLVVWEVNAPHPHTPTGFGITGAEQSVRVLLAGATPRHGGA